MRYYTYVEPDDYGNCIIRTLSEDQIIQEYWDYWSSNMKRIERFDLITKDNCIYDFCVIHWATETDINGEHIK